MDRLKEILDAARKVGAQQAEAYQVVNEETPVKFEATRLPYPYRRSGGAPLETELQYDHGGVLKWSCPGTPS